jgi:DME family drug/metabolite transporter
VPVTRSGARAGTAALVVASVLWGTTGTAASLLPASVSPLAIGASTMAVGGILLFAVSARAARAALVDPVARRWLLVGSVGVVVYPLAFYSAMDEAGVAIGNVVALGSGPVFAALLEWIWERRGLTRRWLVATGIAVVGVALLGSGRHPGDGDATRGDVVAGVLLGLLAGLAYALYSYASSRAIGAGHSGRGVMGGMFGLGALPLLVVLAVTGAPLVQSASSVSIAAYLAVGPMFVAYLLFGYGLTHHRSSVATSVTLVEPLVATVLAVAIVGERLEPTGWVGLACILVGVTALIAARQLPKNPAPF